MDESNYNKYNLRFQSKEKKYGDDWTNTGVEKLCSIKEDAIDQSGMHNLLLSEVKKKRDNLFRKINFTLFSGSVIMFLSSFLSSTNMFENDNRESYAIAATCVSFVGGVISLFVAYLNREQSHFNYSEKVEKNSSAAGKYDNVVDYIESYLYLHPSKRPDIQVCIEGALYRMKTARSNAPDISPNFASKYFELNPDRKNRPPLVLVKSFEDDLVSVDLNNNHDDYKKQEHMRGQLDAETEV
jgi:hypothetical protein